MTVNARASRTYDNLTGDHDGLIEMMVLGTLAYIAVRFFYKLVNAEEWTDSLAVRVRSWLLSLF